VSEDPERMSRVERIQYDADLKRWVEGALTSLGEQLDRHDRMKARAYIDAGEHRLAVEQIAEGLCEDDVPISQKERSQLLQMATVMHSDSNICY
jgi:hypothetical protein